VSDAPEKPPSLPAPTKPRPSPAADREARLAAALRQNLRRRKTGGAPGAPD
jgi:hypothetical protein